MSCHAFGRCDDLACELCDAYDDGYSAGKDKMAAEIEAVLDAKNHAAGCGCRPCQLIRAVLEA